MGALLDRFFEQVAKNTVKGHKNFEEAFYLPKATRPKHTSLRNTEVYVKPTHTVQRASTLLNENVSIDAEKNHKIVAAHIAEIIRNKEATVG